MTQQKKIALIIDGNSFVHRSFHAIPPFTNKEGFPTGAMTGTLKMIHSLIKRLSPDKIFVCFDAKGKTFRHDMYPEYKANRPPTDQNLSIQFEPIQQIIKAWGLPLVCVSGVESDDSMGTLAVKAVEHNYKAIIATSDKDMRQLVTEDILIIDTKDAETKSEYGIEGVIERMGVLPNQVRDLLALMGDKADNIPGVNKVGQDTAAKWLSEYGTLENIIKNADDFKGKRGEYLREAIPLLELSIKLVTIDTNVPLSFDFNDVIAQRDEQALFNLLSQYELNGLKRSLSVNDPSAVAINNNIVLCKNELALSELREKLANVDNRALYVESSNINSDHVLMALNSVDVFYYAQLSDVADVLRSRYEQGEFPVIKGLNVKDVLVKLISSNIIPAYPKVTVQDARLYYYALSGGNSKMPSIEELNNYFCKLSLSSLRKEFNLDEKTPKWDKLTLLQWATVKSEELLLAHHILRRENKMTSSEQLCLEDEHRLMPLLATMQAEGLLIDVGYLETLGAELDVAIANLKAKIMQTAGLDEINLDSPKQVAHLLYDILQIPTKNPTTIAAVLERLAHDYPIVNDILSLRSLSKLKNTYVAGLTSRVDSQYKIHPKFNQGITTTGRLSAEDPNVQSIPVRTVDGAKIRKSFIAPEGFSMVALDYSQIELRVIAHMAKDPALINDFKSGKDIHVSTASSVFGVPYDEVSDDERRAAKAINFGLIYGISAKNLAQDLAIPTAQANDFIKRYFGRYVKLKPFLDATLVGAKHNGFVETHMGRRIYTPLVHSTNPMIRSHGELSAKNANIQGTAADIIKRAMIDIKEHPSLLGDNVKLVMQVHDELVFYIKNGYEEASIATIKSLMENAYAMLVPMQVSVGTGKNWLEAK